MMRLSDAEAKLTAVLKSLRSTPRTTYEADNLHILNCERIGEVKALLANMSGSYVNELQARCAEAERAVEAQHMSRSDRVAAVASAFSLDFEMEEAEETAEAEAESSIAAAKEQKRKKKAGEKEKRKKSSAVANEKKAVKDKRTLDDEPRVAPHPAEADEDAMQQAVPEQVAWTLVSIEDELSSADLPVSVFTSGRGRCEPVPNTAFARLHFTDIVDWDGTACTRAVQLYRCIIVAMAQGEVELSWVDCEELLRSRSLEGVSQTDACRPAFKRDDSAECVLPPTKDDEDSGREEEASAAAEDATLSELLIAEYDAAQLTEEEQNVDTSALPRDVTEKLQQRLRSFTNDVWVILLCHGGYFAGGVFSQGACVVHKAFQRYVVRKKQGGKQSSSAKDVGSYSSAGSQIRAAQEVKWRVEVRDILIDWSPYLRAASFILYAAPGPQNRAVLTDFSLLPAAAAQGGSKGVSPMSLKDRRVSRVPFTTHRPSFEEVKRIYGLASRCHLLHLIEEPSP